MREENYDKILIIYHKDDNDGLMSGALIYNYLINHAYIPKENITLRGVNYNDLDYVNRNSIKELKEQYDSVMITDVSLQPKYMNQLFKLFENKFYWFDHHAPIIKESYSNKFGQCEGVRDTGRSALLCVYKYFYDPFDLKYNDKTLPEILLILSTWDSWTFEKNGYDIQYTKIINIGVLNKLQLDFDKYVQCIQSDNISSKEYVDKCFEIGNIINTQYEFNNRELCSNFAEYDWKVIDEDGTERSAAAVFIQQSTTSQMFTSIKDKVQNIICFKHLRGGKWAISLYNTQLDDKWHCGEFLKRKYKGGGHEGAGGAQFKQSKFIKILKSKTL
jgi:oligoribonuclease NrnB/cAMP/cGMP phosphodiesterase (DHH superfamily)